jgi:hypothetical protein
VVVTSRQHVIQDVTLEWIDAHYSGLFEEVYFGNHFALTGTSRKKSDICRSIGAHVGGHPGCLAGWRTHARGSAGGSGSAWVLVLGL